MKISEDLEIYASFAGVAEAHIAVARDCVDKSYPYPKVMYQGMQKWIYNIFNIFESQMLKKGKSYYVDLVGILRNKVEEEFKDIFSRLNNKSLEVAVK